MLHHSIPTLQGILGSAGYYCSSIYNNGYLNHPTRIFKGMDVFHHYQKIDAKTGTDEAIKFLNTVKNSNYFLFLHYIDPHNYPNVLRKNNPDLYNGPPDAQTAPAFWKAYNDLCRYTDDQLKRLYEWMREQGILEDTYIIYTADHGERFFEISTAEKSMGKKSIRGSHGGSLLKSVTHVPLSIMGPGIHARMVDQRVQLADIVPSALELLGIKEDHSSLSGRSLIPLVHGRKDSDREVIGEFIFWAKEHISLTVDNWKYVLYPEEGWEFLYDLKSDPGERNNLAGERTERIRILGEKVREYLKNAIEEFDSLNYSATQLDAETLNSLKALGYIE